jgi:GYF domain 2
MQTYYFLEGKNVVGPVSLEELHSKNITTETFVWYDGLQDWMKLKEVPKLFYKLEALSTNQQPELELKQNYAPGKPPPVKRKTSLHTIYKMLLGWVIFNCFALAASLLKIPFFNNDIDAAPEKFWPFVKFTDKNFTMIEKTPVEIWQTKITFNGLFVHYDWTEFSAYVGGTLFIVLLYQVNKKTNA